MVEDVLVVFVVQGHRGIDVLEAWNTVELLDFTSFSHIWLT